MYQINGMYIQYIMAIAFVPLNFILFLCTYCQYLQFLIA